MASSSSRFEEIRNDSGILYKLRGKLSKNKTVDITMVPRTKMAYMHINDYTNAYADGTFNKNNSKFVSLSMSTMDPQVLGLIQSNVPAAKKRKTENIRQEFATKVQIPPAVNDQVTAGTCQSVWPMNYASDHPMSSSYDQGPQQDIIPDYSYHMNNQHIGPQYQVGVASQPVGHHYQSSQLMEQQYQTGLQQRHLDYPDSVLTAIQ